MALDTVAKTSATLTPSESAARSGVTAMEASTTAYSVTTEASAYFRTGILDLPAHSHGRALVGIMTLKALGYFAPILVGAILVVFMVKPLFARTR